MKPTPTGALRIALAVVLASAITAMSPTLVEAKKTTTTKKRPAVTYTSTFPTTRSGEIGNAKPTFAAFEDLGYTDGSEDFLPTDRPRVNTPESAWIGGEVYVSVRGFWSREPRKTDAAVTLTITDPEGRRAYMLLTGDYRLVPDIFAEGADRRFPASVGPDFTFFARPKYPLGKYSLVATSAKGRRARASFTLVVPERPTGLRIITQVTGRPLNTVRDEVRVTWAGYLPASPIGLLIYKAKPIAGPTRFEYEFFARFEPIPTDENGSLEMDISTKGAAPGRYCFVTDEATPSGCGGENTIQL
jgi:hypothetical protein